MPARCCAVTAIAPLLIVLALAPRAAAASPGLEHIDLPGTGSYTLSYVPYSLSSTAPAPAIVFLHGSGLGPEYWAQQTHLLDLAEELGFVLIMPRAGLDLDFGVGADDVIVDAAVRAAEQRVAIDTRRVGLSGFSAGAAYALQLAYSTPASFTGVFAMASSFRSVIRLANPAKPPPYHLYYGDQDPNYLNQVGVALDHMFDRLAVPHDPTDVVPGLGHVVPPDASLRAGFAFLLGQPLPTCVSGPTAMCLRGRFRVEASWQTANAQGDAGVVQLTGESGYLWFFDPSNVELSVKAIDGCPLNQRYWLYASGTTDVRVVLTVTDTLSNAQVVYVEAGGAPFQPKLDSGAFATCP